MTQDLFRPVPPIFDGLAHPNCRASVIIPARNEEESIPSALDALATQVDLSGLPLEKNTYEVLLLLNNCTDQSVEVAANWRSLHPAVTLHIVVCELEREAAHAGTARRMLMDTAWHRLKNHTHECCGILSTDSDTVVAPNWIAQNMNALEQGAHAVGGAIQLKPGEIEALPDGARQAYILDRQYQMLVAELEDLLDPQIGDPWPRHLEHFGASLACTPEAYAAVGGMPAVKPLEDVAFVNALRACDARLRHDPSVIVYTSSRFDGRAEIGLSFQLREWQRMSMDNQQHLVPTSEWLTHRFTSLFRLRRFYRNGEVFDIRLYSAEWRETMEISRRTTASPARFLSAIDCDRYIETTFEGCRHGSISEVNAALYKVIANLKTLSLEERVDIQILEVPQQRSKTSIR